MRRSLYISYDGAYDSIGQSQILPYLKGLSKEGIDFTLLTYEKKETLLNREIISVLKNDLKENDIRWFYLKYTKKPPVASTLFDIIKGTLVGVWLVSKHRINCIHARSYVASLIGIILKRLFKVRFIFDMRGFWADERVEGRIWKTKGVIYSITKFLEKRYFLSSDEVVVLTEKAKDIIGTLDYEVKSNINVIPCMVDIERFRFNTEDRHYIRAKYGLDSKFVFLYSGSLEYWYMKNEMLEFFKTAENFIQGSHFLILSTMDKRFIEPLIISKGIGKDRFTILERIPYSEMPKFISASDTGIFFITPVFSKRASSPTKFAEYMSCGLPVITNSQIGDLDKLISGYRVGTTVNAFSEEEYKNKIRAHISLLDEKNIKERCIRLAKEVFDLGSGVEAYARIYARLNGSSS